MFISKRLLPNSLEKVKKELKKQSKTSLKKRTLNLAEKTLIQQIQGRTSGFNINNVTRTKAYLDFYNNYPEIHWAFLGHMVSRNGGWNMTDLKGELLQKLLSNKERNTFFAFLERGNWLIFQDVYPQFLLYEESLRKGENLFYLLPHMNISSFMETIWSQFLENQDTYVLTVSLIINEQSYLESRVINNPTYKKEVFSTLEFMLQDILSMNHVIFPYKKNGRLKLAGQTLHHFQSLHERILLGKRLYSVLFDDPERLKLVEKWASENPHTGSRKDYWPNIFHDIDEGLPRFLLKKKLKNCKLLPGSSRIYSPCLQYVWKDTKQHQAEIGDWYKKWQVIYYLIDTKEKIDGEIEDEYCKTLERIELAAIAKKAIFLLD